MNNICTECGLDNTKSDRNYRMKQNTEKTGSLTHEHGPGRTHGGEEKTVQKVPRRLGQADPNPRPQQANRQIKPKKNVLSLLVSVIFVIAAIFTILPVLLSILVF